LTCCKTLRLTTAFFYNWEELRDLGRPGALNASFMVKDSTGDGTADTAVAQLAARWLAHNPFNFTFVYLGGTDIAGHAWGWMSEPYLQAIAHADRCIGTVVDALPPDCTILVTSDHGGHEQMHGTDCPEDMTTPLLLAGPGSSGGRHASPNRCKSPTSPPPSPTFLASPPPKSGLASPSRPHLLPDQS
jgi:hypothetical protein